MHLKILRVSNYGLLSTFSFLLLLILSCDGVQQQNQDQVKSYYDVKGFVDGQISKMNKEKPYIVKLVSMGTESNKVSTKEVDWKKELELFLQADINKPAFRQSYSTTKPDSFTTIYTVRPDEQQLTVQYLKIVLDSLNKAPKSIQATLKSENKLYESEKTIDLQCSVGKTGTQIVSYHIKGYQKLATMDKKPFDVNVKVDH